MLSKEQLQKFEFPEVEPQNKEMMAGRPVRQRINKVEEMKKRKSKRSTTITGSICKTLGHNARSCRGGPTAKQRKQAASASTNASCSTSRQ